MGDLLTTGSVLAAFFAAVHLLAALAFLEMSLLLLRPDGKESDAPRLSGPHLVERIGLFVMIVLGGIAGAIVAGKVQMTQMPELVAGFHSLVGLAAVLVACAAFLDPIAFGIADETGSIFSASRVEMILGVAIGAITFSGSIIAFLKLNGNMSGAPILLPARHLINLALLLAIVVFTYGFWSGQHAIDFWLVVGLAAFWLLFRVVALAVLQLFADEVVALLVSGNRERSRRLLLESQPGVEQRRAQPVGHFFGRQRGPGLALIGDLAQHRVDHAGRRLALRPHGAHQPDGGIHHAMRRLAQVQQFDCRQTQQVRHLGLGLALQEPAQHQVGAIPVAQGGQCQPLRPRPVAMRQVVQPPGLIDK